MKIEEIISSLLDQIDDRESLILLDDPDSIFKHDAEALREAITTIKTLTEENGKLRAEAKTCQAAQSERDAAVSDLEEIMFIGGQNTDTCKYCSTQDCYGRGGHRLCAPVWRGKQKEEETDHE